MRLLIGFMLFVSAHAAASDDFMVQVCNATVDPAEKKQCFLDMYAEKKKQELLDEMTWLYGSDCKNDSKCYAASVFNSNKKWRYRCQKAVESRAKYQFRWTDGWAEHKFPQFTTPQLRERDDLGDYSVGFVGRSLQFQNGFSAWMPMTYICWFNPIINQVVEVKVSDGRHF
jgi:hypothetical protein